ncbi:MAG: GNAT family protein [Thermoleophilia bacterium]
MTEPAPRPLGPGALLRPVRAEDAADLLAIVDANRERLRRWLPWVDGTRQDRDSRTFLAAALAQSARGDGTQFALVVDDRLAGVVGFHAIDRRLRSTAIGYWVGAAYEGAGHVTRAVASLLDLAFGDWGLARVEIRAAPDNVRSRAIPERLGFQEERVVRRAEWLGDRWVDHVVYGMTAEEWSASRAGG